jgi:hypothetical protein
VARSGDTRQLDALGATSPGGRLVTALSVLMTCETGWFDSIYLQTFELNSNFSKKQRWRLSYQLQLLQRAMVLLSKGLSMNCRESWGKTRRTETGQQWF